MRARAWGPAWPQCLKYFLKIWQPPGCSWLLGPRPLGEACPQGVTPVGLAEIHTEQCVSSHWPRAVAKETHASSQAISRMRCQSGNSSTVVTAAQMSHSTLPVPSAAASKPRGFRGEPARRRGRKAEGGGISLFSLHLLCLRK